jgi:TonB family protein
MQSQLIFKSPAERQKSEIFLPSNKREKNWWFLSFLIALALHILLIFGGRYMTFIQPPDYGIAGTSASLEVYMVAALPEQAKSLSAEPKKQEEKPLDLIEAKSEMEIYQPKEKKDDSRLNSGKDDKSKQLKDEKSKVIGDGSSKVPGESSTTFLSRGSSATDGKSGKYQNAPPEYPLEAQKKGWQGLVILKALIEKEGKPAQVLIEEGSGHKMLDQVALEAVKDWKFVPGHVGNLNVSSWVKIPIRFELSQNGEAKVQEK